METSSKEKRKVLWVSMLAPYDKVPHAGGKTHNFYIKGLNKSGLFNIRLVTFASKDDLPKIDLNDYGIDYQLITGRKTTNIFKRIVRGIHRRFHSINFFSRDAGFTSTPQRQGVLTELNALKHSGYVPDVIILEWTQIVLLREDIAKIFPNVPIVAMEEDVAYLTLKRWADFETSTIKRYFRRKLSIALKHRELQTLHDSSLVIVNNIRDEKVASG